MEFIQLAEVGDEFHIAMDGSYKRAYNENKVVDTQKEIVLRPGRWMGA
jgi:hypothetical protein